MSPNQDLLYNQRMNKYTKGYTIAELLAVMSILIVISGVITGILYSTLRGSNRVKITTEVTQNGTYALGFMTRAINDSRNIVSIGGTPIADCTADPNPSGKSIVIKRIDGATTEFECSGAELTVDNVSLINTDQIQSDLASCTFSCTQTTDDLYSVPIINIEFKLEDRDATLPEARSSSTFKTSVLLKNYRP